MQIANLSTTPTLVRKSAARIRKALDEIFQRAVGRKKKYVNGPNIRKTTNTPDRVTTEKFSSCSNRT
jgi:hypothetical protein